MEYPKKIVLLGHFGVGKTSLVRQFVDTIFSEDYLVTVGVHLKKKEVLINEQKVQLIIWDVEGNTSVEKARSSYLLGSHGFLYVFDITRPTTYENIASEMAFLSEHFPEVPRCIVGNKADLFTQDFTPDFFTEDALKQCFFCSAKTGENVSEVFNALAKKTMEV